MAVKTKKKLLSLTTLKNKIRQHRSKGHKIAFTNGCFDILHAGHVSYLEAAKACDRILIVGLNSDKSTRSIKGPKRPIVPETERAAVLSALACVDYITIFHEDTPERIIGILKPDILIKGEDWRGKQVAGSTVVKANGGRVLFMPYIKGKSSTDIIDRIRKIYC